MTNAEAIETLKANYPDACYEQLREAVDKAILILSLPSAEPERGQWIDIGGIIRFGCPFCHHAYETKSNFCPNCGKGLD